jgi:hypothetical protein
LGSFTLVLNNVFRKNNIKIHSVLMSLKKLLLLLVVSLMSLSAAAQVKVSGVVMSADDNQPIIGATVTLKGNASVGTATDLDGKFTLSVPSLKSRLVVTYVGSKTKEVSCHARRHDCRP